MQLNKPTMLIKHKMLQKQANDQNCQSIKNVESKYDDLDSQSTVLKCSDKKCQEKMVMLPVKPPMDVQLKEPAEQSSFKKKHVPLYKDKNCKATMSHKKQKKGEYKDSKSHISRNSDKNCKEKESSNMWSVTSTNDVWLPKPPIPYEYRRMCSDKNCHSTGYYSLKKKSPRRPMYDKNCQS